MNYLEQNYEWKDIIIVIGGQRLDILDFNVNRFQLKTAYNNHGRLELEFFIKNNINLYRGIAGSSEQKVEVYFNGNGQEILFFTGVVSESWLSFYGNDGYTFSLMALSRTILSDKVKVFRSYQNPGITYKEVVDSVAASNQGLNLQYEPELFRGRIERPIIQYDETDWEFLIRICSHLGLGVAPIESGGILLGYMKNDIKVKECDLSRAEFATGKNSYGESLYRIRGKQNYTLANVIKLTFDDREAQVPVVEGLLYYSDGDMVGEYTLAQKSYRYPYLANNKIAGKVIEGRVTELPGGSDVATVAIDITKGLRQVASEMSGLSGRYQERVTRGEYRNNNWVYSYTTPYSQSNTGYFCAPEVGDGVSIYFPTNEESMGYVMGAINSPNSARFSNPNVRNYTLPGNYDLRLNTDTITEYAKANISKTTDNLLSLTSGDVTRIKSASLLGVKVDSNIEVEASSYKEQFDSFQANIAGEKQEFIGDYKVNYMGSTEVTASSETHNVTGVLASMAAGIVKKV